MGRTKKLADIVAKVKVNLYKKKNIISIDYKWQFLWGRKNVR